MIERAIKRHGLRLRIGEHLTVVNPEFDERFREYWQEYHRLTARDGVTAQYAKLELRRRTTLIAAMLVRKGEADGLICGTISTTARHLHYIDQVIGRRAGVHVYGAMSGLILPGRQVFLVDTHVNLDPTAEQLAEIIGLAANQLRAFGLVPKVALLSHSNFGSEQGTVGSQDARRAEMLRERRPDSRWTAKCTATVRWTKRSAKPSAGQYAARQRQFTGVPEPGQRQHRIQFAQVRGRSERCHRTDAAGLRRAGPHTYPCGHRSPPRQHDRDHGGRSLPRQCEVCAPGPAAW